MSTEFESGNLAESPPTRDVQADTKRQPSKLGYFIRDTLSFITGRPLEVKLGDRFYHNFRATEGELLFHGDTATVTNIYGEIDGIVLQGERTPISVIVPRESLNRRHFRRV